MSDSFDWVWCVNKPVNSMSPSAKHVPPFTHSLFHQLFFWFHMGYAPIIHTYKNGWNLLKIGWILNKNLISFFDHDYNFFLNFRKKMITKGLYWKKINKVVLVNVSYIFNKIVCYVQVWAKNLIFLIQSTLAPIHSIYNPFY